MWKTIDRVVLIPLISMDLSHKRLHFALAVSNEPLPFWHPTMSFLSEAISPYVQMSKDLEPLAGPGCGAAWHTSAA